jgi:hypothetical protein
MPIRGYSYTETDWQVVSCKLKGATIDFHGFFIRKQEDGESIYGPRLSSQEILKLTFDRKEGKVIKQLGYNNRKYEVGTNRTPWIKWRTGIMTAPPHGVAFNAKGDLFVAEYSTIGRVHRLNRK